MSSKRANDAVLPVAAAHRHAGALLGNETVGYSDSCRAGKAASRLTGEETWDLPEPRRVDSVSPADSFPALTRLSDEKLIEKFRSVPAEDVFEELVRRYITTAYKAALAMLGLREDAKDAVQECFLRVIRARSSYRPGTPFPCWFFTILRNICRDEGRRRLLAARSLVRLADRAPECDPPSEVEMREHARAARRAFRKLPESERELLTLRIDGGLEFPEIAAICGISTEAAKKRAYRGLDRLRSQLSARA